MHLLSCLHPKRVWNKYRNEFVWVPCRECEQCRNAHAAKWTAAIERERKMHRFSYFFTLTYDDKHLPRINVSLNDFDSWSFQYSLKDDSRLWISSGDSLDIDYKYLRSLCEVDADKVYLDKMLNYYGLPYASSYDIQCFVKRLNKYFHDKVTNSFKNFRYFICSEYGSTTFRPHFHGVLFVDDSNVANRVKEGVFSCWQLGRVDCQPVEKSAGAYVAQYVNKSSNLPLFYRKGKIRQRFYCSKFPTIGACCELSETDEEIFNYGIVTEVCALDSRESKPVVVPLSASLENQLFPKCLSFGTLSHSSRVECYRLNRRFSAKSPRDLMDKLVDYVNHCFPENEFDFFICSRIKDIWSDSEVLFNFVRRLYYTSSRFIANCKKFSVSFMTCYKRICDYWSNKELYLLKQFYMFQEVESQRDTDSLVMMYPEFCYQNFGKNDDLNFYIDNFQPVEYLITKAEMISYSITNRLTHFKNAYLDAKAMQRDNSYFYKLLKDYFYAKKCNEAFETFPASCEE